MAFEEGPHLERVKRNENRRWPILAIGLGIVLVALAVIHPWGPDLAARPDATDPATAQSVSEAAPPATPGSPIDAAGLFPQCFPSLGWRVASMQQQALLNVRTAWPATVAPLPTPPNANTPTLSGSGVEAIGFCTPGTDELTRSQYVGDVSLWRRAPSGAMVRVDGASVLDTELAAQGEVYLKPPAAIAVNGTWPPGDYYFQVRPRGAPLVLGAPGSRWFALRIQRNGATTTS